MIKNVTQGKKAQILIRFHNANKTNNYNSWGERKGKKKKIPKKIYRASQNIRIIVNVFLESLLSELFPSLGVTVHLTSLGCPPTAC